MNRSLIRVIWKSKLLWLGTLLGMLLNARWWWIAAALLIVSISPVIYEIVAAQIWYRRNLRRKADRVSQHDDPDRAWEDEQTRLAAGGW